MACNTKVYTGITREVFYALVSKAKTEGLSLAGDSGVAGLHGCQFEWSYAEETETLMITCTHKPFFVGCDTINEKLDELLKV